MMPDMTDLIRRAQAASDRLDVAKGAGNPFEMIHARRAAEDIMGELARAANVDRALQLLKMSQARPQSLFEANAPPGLTQSSNAGSAPSDSRVPVAPSGGSITSPKSYLRTSSYTPEQRRAAALLGDALPDGSHVIRNADDLGESLIAWAQSGKPDGALKDHLTARAKALHSSASLPPEFRADADKLALAARLRKN